MNRIGISVRLVCAPSLAHTRRVLRFPGRSFPEHHAFSLRPSESRRHEAVLSHPNFTAQLCAAQVSQGCATPHTYFMKHVRLVSWFISCSPTQSLYPGRPRGGLTVFPSRHLSPDADLRNPEGLLCTCAPPRARSSCPTVPLSELPEPHLRVVEDFVSLARPLATAFRPHPSSTSTMRHAAGCAKPHLVCAPTAHTPLVTSGIESSRFPTLSRHSPRTTSCEAD